METKKLTRSLNISFLTDPYLAVLMKRMYLKNIKGEVDEVNIQINGQNLEVIEFIRKLWEDEAKIIWKVNKPETVNHGEALNDLYKISTGDIFIILDSDNFIYQKGIIDRECDRIEKFDYVGSQHPYMSFFKRELLEKIDVDFREKYFKENRKERFYDTMEELLIKIGGISKRMYLLPVDVLGEYEHIGRMSAFGIYAEQCYLDTDTGLLRNVRKLFGRANRVALIKYIYEITKDEVNLPKFNESYWKTFLEVCQEVGHKQENIDQIMKENIIPKLKDYARQHRGG